MNSSRSLTLILVLLVALGLSFVSLGTPALANYGVQQLTSSSTTSTTTMSTISIVSSTSTTTSTSTSSTSTTTTSTSISTSYTETVTRTTTSVSTSTSYTGTITNTGFVTITTTTPQTQVTTSITTSSSRTTVAKFPGCFIALVTTGSALEPYANFLRGFRNDQILNTTAGRDFMIAFNGWYYSWAPAVSAMAVSNSWLGDALQVGVYPLIWILYASYFSYVAMAPLSSEAGAVVAGMVAASLIGLVYVTPIVCLCTRILRHRARAFIVRRTHTLPAAAWVGASFFMIGAAYISASPIVMGVATASLVLSALSLGSMLGAMALASIRSPVPNLLAITLTIKRITQALP